MNENLQTNAFFLALLDHIPDLEKCCVESGWTLCVPHSSAMPESHRMSLRLLKMHVLKPTAQPGVFETLNPSVMVKKLNDKEMEVIHKGCEGSKANPSSKCYNL